VATFCLIHGNWHDGACWAPVAERLRERGYDVVAPDMPFDDPRLTFEERAGPAVDALEGVDDALVVGHSVASAEAPIVAAARDAALVVYLCPRFGSFEPAPGAPAAFQETLTFPPRAADGRMTWEPETAIAEMYGRLAPETARELASKLRPSASPVGDYPLAEHPNVPAALVYGSYDEFFRPEWERFVAREMLGVDPIELATGHFPMAEDPDALTDVLDRLAAP
jgi:pimeloyl-ACP methyl ester carboxylesterase